MSHNFQVLIISDLGGGSGESPPVSPGSRVGVTVSGCHLWLLL